MRVALVHDYLVEYGGAERVLSALAEIFPYAPIYTLVYDEKLTKSAFANKKIHTSFLQKIPGARARHRLFPILMPMAIEQFDFSRFDLVFSDSGSYAKGVITLPNVLHICYCHTPMRYAWDDSQKYIKEFKGYSSLIKKFVPFLMNYIRLWDKISADRPDYFIANSHFVSERIKKYYHRDSEVIYPPVDTNKSKVQSSRTNPFGMLRDRQKSKVKRDYFLMVGRLLSYKRFDMAIETFNRLGLPLKIIGEGPEMKRLKKRANSNIEFLGWLPDAELTDYYSRARAFIFPQEEDFGIVPLEAMAVGTPVIAFKAGGALETVEENKTGIFFDKESIESLIKAIENFQKKEKEFDPVSIREHALKFDKEIFKEKIEKFIEKVYNFKK